MTDLSILIPARNETFLKNTVEDILQHIEADTEIIALLDGQWTNPPLEQNDRVNLIYVNKVVGQRAGTNLACKLARGKYVMKVDAHCAFDQGFDRKMIEGFAKSGDNVTMLPIMRNLWVFDWVCPKCSHVEYQDRVPTCPECGTEMKKELKWIAKKSPRSVSYAFDAEPKFCYFEDWKHRPEFIKQKQETGLTETMSIQGSCFMLTREKYWELNISDDTLGNWGNQGVQVACATWLSGGRILINHNTWYAHLFRTKSNFSFPWPVSGKDQRKTKENVKELFWQKGHPKQIRPVSWLVKKFMPIPGWTEEDLKKLEETEFKP
jgi:glycosyltransferase involved in cell wall biosynthesis